MQERIEKGLNNDKVEVEIQPLAGTNGYRIVGRLPTGVSSSVTEEMATNQPERLEDIGRFMRQSLSLHLYELAQELDPEMMKHEFTKAKMEVVKSYRQTGEFGVFNA